LHLLDEITNGRILALAKAMAHDEIARHIQAKESELIAQLQSHIDFEIDGTLCRIQRTEAGLRYYLRAVTDWQFASAQELTAAILRHQRKDITPRPKGQLFAVKKNSRK
jgi:hypothetical protein